MAGFLHLLAVQDKISSFWEITKQEVAELKAILRQKDREAEEAEDKHQIEVKASLDSSPSTPCLENSMLQSTSEKRNRLGS